MVCERRICRTGPRQLGSTGGCRSLPYSFLDSVVKFAQNGFGLERWSGEGNQYVLVHLGSISSGWLWCWYGGMDGWLAGSRMDQ